MIRNLIIIIAAIASTGCITRHDAPQTCDEAIAEYTECTQQVHLDKDRCLVDGQAPGVEWTDLAEECSGIHISGLEWCNGEMARACGEYL